MEFSFRGPPTFWERVIEMAEIALNGGTDQMGDTRENDPAATSDWRITFIGDPEGDGIGLLFFPSDESIEDGAGPWLEISERVAST